MKRTFVLFAAFALVLAACSGDDATEGDPTTSTTTAVDSDSTPTSQGPQEGDPQADGTFFRIVEIGVAEDQFVAMLNFTDVDATIEGLWLCQQPTYTELPATVVPAGETVYLTSGDGSGLDVDGIVVTGVNFGALRPLDGEIALYQERDFDNPDTMTAYIQWGKTPHGRTDEAIEAGLWVEGAWAPTGANAVRLWVNLDTGLWLWDASEA